VSSRVISKERAPNNGVTGKEREPIGCGAEKAKLPPKLSILSVCNPYITSTSPNKVVAILQAMDSTQHGATGVKSALGRAISRRPP
jgi:hypothetical protein